MDIRLENLAASKSGYLRLLPNINRTGRALPDEASTSDLTSNAKVDCELPTRRLADKEIYSLIIDISDAEAAANPKMTLEATYDPARFLMLNASAIPLTDQQTQPFTLDLAQARRDGTKARGVQYYIEAQTFGGSPLLNPKASLTMTFRILAADGSVLLSKSTLATGGIRTADVILLGDDARWVKKIEAMERREFSQSGVASSGGGPRSE
jgi:hypothetical protein